MKTDDIRAAFLNFFQSKGHTIVSSDTLVPRSDPTLLFTGAGMNQFKEQFLGKNITFQRAVTCQKCLRTGDLENVGRTSGHHTFFEMLGNFSFGDYFKEEAIRWAWEFMTETLELPKERLLASVYKDDEEANKIWRRLIGLPQNKVVQFGAKDNFWPSNAQSDGPNGPCGPCSEIFYDRGKDTGCLKASCNPACDCGRFVEAWNLVFTQFDRQPDGSLKNLAHKNIDTGMGLERITAVIEGVKTNFEIDSFQPVLEAVKEEFARAHGKDPDWRRYTAELNAIADHVRAVVFSIGDGVMPSNEGRGYVIRKLIRRSVLHSWGLFGQAAPFLYKLVSTVARVMEQPYPDLKRGRESIAQVVRQEEENFILTIENQGPHVLDTFSRMASKKQRGEAIAEELAKIAFNFYDTYGIPYDVLEEFAEKKSLTIERVRFDQLLDEQRKRSRRKTKIQDSIFSETFETTVKSLRVTTQFVGYRSLSAKAAVLALFIENTRKKEAQEGAVVELVLDTTPFYGEAGGQAGDKGILKNKACEIEITGVKVMGAAYLHIGRVLSGTVKEGDTIEAAVDRSFRMAVERNHTATHLLQYALRKVLGGHVRQAGSVVDNRRLRFDFTHVKKLYAQELERVEGLVNDAIQGAVSVATDIMEIGRAKNLGALALFGEKYDTNVRVVSVGGSKELCGGTHVKNSKDIELLKITGETSVASGVRRIEAVTAEAAKEAVIIQKQELERRFGKCKSALKDSPAQEKEKLSHLTALFDSVKGPAGTKEVTIASYEAWKKNGLVTLKSVVEEIEVLLKKTLKKREKEKARQALITVDADTLLRNAKHAGDTVVVLERLNGMDITLLRNVADVLKSKIKSAVIFLGSIKDGNAYLICSVTVDLTRRGIRAGDIVKKAAKEVGGSGGGRPDFAQAGGKDVTKLDAALNKAFEIVNKELS